MNCNFPDFLSVQLRQPGILNPPSIQKLKGPAGSSDPRHRRNGLDGFAKFPFLPAKLLHSELIQRPKECQKRSYAQQAEPNRLVPGRRDGEVQSRSVFVPHSVVIAGDYSEMVVAGAEPRIKSFAPSAYVLPVFIHSVEPVPKMHLLRHSQAQS